MLSSDKAGLKGVRSSLNCEPHSVFHMGFLVRESGFQKEEDSNAAISAHTLNRGSEKSCHSKLEQLSLCPPLF